MPVVHRNKNSSGYPGWMIDSTRAGSRHILELRLAYTPMTGVVLYPTEGDFEGVIGCVERAVETDRRLPDWPFRVLRGNADICQFGLALEGPFGAVLQALVDTHGDDTVSAAVLDPSPSYYRENYGSYPGFKVQGQSIGATYWDSVAYEPGGDPTGAMTYTANVATVVGSSGSWAVWAERSWDLAVVLSQHTDGPWTSCGVNFVSAAEGLANFTEPEFKVPLPPSVRSTFLRNLSMRGQQRNQHKQ